MTIYRKQVKSWHLFIIFILGMCIGEIMPEPTDFIYFYAQGQGSITPELSVYYWYFLSATFYAAILVLAVILWKTGKASPRTIIYVLIFFLIVGAILTYRTLEPDIASPTSRIAIIVILASITLVAILYVAGYRVSISGNGKKH